MFRFTIIPLAAFLLPVSVVRADDQAPGRKIIEKAIAAQGGADKLERIKAMFTRAKGKVLTDSGWYSFTAESWIQQPTQFKNIIRINQNFTETLMVEILNGDKGWIFHKELDGRGQFEPASKDDLQEMQKRAYVDFVGSLTPLLQDKKFHFETLTAVRGDDSELLGVKITSPGKAEVSLFFSKKTGLLARRQFKLKDLRTGTDQVHDYRLNDYHEANPSTQGADVLKSAKLSPEPAALLDYLTKQCISDADRAKNEELIKKLGDSSFDVRAKAKQDLLAKGATAMPELRKAIHDADPEISGAARESIRDLEKSLDTRLLSAVLRMIADTRPKGATATLLKYLPSVPSDSVRRDVEGTLSTVGFQDGKPDSALVDALKDKDPDRRAVAESLINSPDHGKTASSAPTFVRGVLLPAKESLYVEGSKVMEWEITDVKLFDHLNAKEHFRPR